MTNNIDLKKTEQASYRLAVYADGTSDLGLGLVFLLLGVYPYTREQVGPAWNFPLFLAALGLVVLAQYLTKRRLAPSRIGIVKLGPRVQKRLRAALLATIILLALTVLTWVGAGQGVRFAPTFLGSYTFEILVALIMLAIFWGIAYTFEMTRFYFYGVLLGVVFPVQQLLPAQVYEGIPYLVAGGIITGIGVYLLVRFLKQFPALDLESDTREM
jgi:hypothetical protein